jgi:uncharacterized protein (TIGR00297 family)
MQTQLFIGIILGATISLLAWWIGALSRSGAFAAFIVGSLIFGLGGFTWAMLLLTFFISSSVLSRFGSKEKTRLTEKFSKGSRRDWSQVLANGGLGALLVIIHSFPWNNEWAWVAFAGAMAAVNADTWATELGVFSPQQPRLITSGKTVEKGSSGGITWLGYLAALGGAMLVGIVAAIFSPSSQGLLLTMVSSLSGLLGSTCDSLLGATVQAIYHCPTCQKETERHPKHTCGSQTSLIRGWIWLDNDWVNFTCSLAGALSAIFLWSVL